MGDEDKTAMERVSLASAQVLVELVADNATVEKELLERRFGERARGFEETLKFMEGMRALVESGRDVRRANGLDSMQEALREGERAFVEHMAKVAVRSTTRYGKEMRGVLNAFKLKEGQSWLVSEELGGEYYAARNMLLEAGAIQLDHDSGTYTIDNWFYSEFIRARYTHGTTPNELRDVIEDQAEIGLAAELKVFEYERAIVGEQDAAKVVHIALENTNAGFDIVSIRREQETKQIRLRMIEVKAVSLRDWAFTLTMNEVRMATESEDTYFLYLIPVIEGNPTVARMEIVQNPVRELLCKNEWAIEDGDWNVCRTVRYG